MVTKYIAHCDKVLQSCNYFRCSMKGVSPKQNPPPSRQKNNKNQLQNRQNQQDNCRRDQQPTLDHRQCYARWGGGRQRNGPPPLVIKNGWICCRRENVRRVHLRPNMSVTLCKRCTIIGYECPNSSNYTQWDHTTFASLSQEDKDVLSDWINAIHYLHWSRNK